MRFNGLDTSLVETFETTPDFYEKVQVDERPTFVKSLGRRPHGTGRLLTQVLLKTF